MNECRVSPTISELGLSALFGHNTASAEIKLVAFQADAQAGQDLNLWQPTSAASRRPGHGEIIVTSACFSPLFNGVVGLGFVPFDLIADFLTDPVNQFHNIKLCSLPPYDPHKRRPHSAWHDLPR